MAEDTSMVTITFSDKKLSEQQTAAYAFFLHEDFSFDKECKQVAKDYFQGLKALFAERAFTGKQNSRGGPRVPVFLISKYRVYFPVFANFLTIDTNPISQKKNISF